MFAISKEAIHPSDCASQVFAEAAGAFVSFEGRVRNHNEGKAVTALEYEIYHAMAIQEGLAILEEARSRFAILDARAVHREGKLQIGDCAVWVGVLAAHRDSAYRASRYIIDAIKQRLPIWKKEYYRDASCAWVACAHTVTPILEKDYYRQQTGAVGPGGSSRFDCRTRRSWLSRKFELGRSGRGQTHTL